MSSDEPDEPRPPTFVQMLKSTLGAAIGVQSRETRERDFTRGRASHYIAFGIGFTVLFVLTIVFVVRTVLGTAT